MSKRKNRTAEYKRWRELPGNRVKKRAHDALYKAIKKGLLVKGEICEACGMRKFINGHHENYNKPLEVIWLCPTCHRKIHTERDEMIRKIPREKLAKGETIEGCRCERCAHLWTPRSKNTVPLACPKCKTYLWQFPVGVNQKELLKKPWGKRYGKQTNKNVD